MTAVVATESVTRRDRRITAFLVLLVVVLVGGLAAATVLVSNALDQLNSHDIHAIADRVALSRKIDSLQSDSDALRNDVAVLQSDNDALRAQLEKAGVRPAVPRRSIVLPKPTTTTTTPSGSGPPGPPPTPPPTTCTVNPVCVGTMCTPCVP